MCLVVLCLASRRHLHIAMHTYHLVLCGLGASVREPMTGPIDRCGCAAAAFAALVFALTTFARHG
jgi:hypothetical protein